LSIAVQGALVARHVPTRAAYFRGLLVLLTALGLALTVAFSQVTTVAAGGGSDSEPAKGSQAAAILRLARQAVGHPFRLGTEGPRFFDCSGLVWSVYKRAGLVGRIGGARRTVTGYYNWAQRHGKISRRNPQPGDIVIWGSRGRLRHSGIYVGDGRVISALNPKLGTRIHGLGYVHFRVWGFIHTGISR
jgi:cell wall-associated NlpC family hydrolase